MDLPPQDERSVSPDKPDLLWTPDIEADIVKWQQTGVFPFPELFLHHHGYMPSLDHDDRRLVYHVAALCRDLAALDATHFTIWTSQIPLFLSIGASFPFVLNALLALSASHLAWLTECPLTANLACEHRGRAMQGLQQAIGAFSRENSDAVLAASLLLSWQATDWRGWTQLMQGTSSIIDAMAPWKSASQFGDFMAEQSTFPTAPPSPQAGAKLAPPRPEDLETLGRCYTQLQTVERFLKDAGEDLKIIQQLMGFVRSVQKVSASHTAVQRFEMLNPLRQWLFWLPVMLLQQTTGSPCALITLAHYYAVALAIEPLFPEVGAAYFGSLSLVPVEQIARRIFALSMTVDIQAVMVLLEYPVDMVSQFRTRMGWVHPLRTASFPVFESALDVSSYGTPVSPYGTPAFAYSHEHLLAVSSEPASAISPLSIDPLASHYLGIPSPSGLAAFHSPASSHFGEESLVYSDHGDDFALYESQSFVAEPYHSPSLKMEYPSYAAHSRSHSHSHSFQHDAHAGSPIILTPADFLGGAH